MKLLLTSVFGPFGVTDEYGEKENKMELFHNQVTKEQGLFSYRFNHASHGLYFMAENIDVPTNVLDFPTLKRFKKELKKGYDYVGISFIVPNLKKAQKMARMVRELSPKTKIIIGSHGTNIPNIENIIDHDHICVGEGIAYLRRLFGEDVNKPIKHPLTYSSFNREVMGVPWPADAGILITGVGCANKCRFCATSHYFGKYTPYLKTGQEIFDVCCRYEDEMGIKDMGVLDENFLKTKDRALEFIEICEKENRYFSLAIFSSAETLTSLGDLDILVRMGVKFIWIGVESKKEVYEKNAGVDFKWLFSELRKRGISVMASAILFLEEHDKKTIWDDIEFVSNLEPDYLQFMQLGPIHGTPLYETYEQEGKLMTDIPYEHQHGQKKIWFNHPNFTRDETEVYLERAFKYDYHNNGASVVRAIKTALNGYDYCRTHSNPFVQRRIKDFESTLKMGQFFLLSSAIFSENDATDDLLKEIKQRFKASEIKRPLIHWIGSFFVVLFSLKEYLRIRFISDVRQPQTLYKKYNIPTKVAKPAMESRLELPKHKRLATELPVK